MSIDLYLGDCMDVLPKLAENSIDSCVTDPPYGLNFMGKNWDRGVPNVDVWRHVYRVLKPGAHLLSFGGTRTYHRMACAIEDAGFEIRDQIQWLYGSGFPKSHNVSKSIDNSLGAERERVKVPVAAPTEGIYGKYSGEIDGNVAITPEPQAWDGWGTALKPANEPIVLARKPLSESTVAANVLKWGTGALNIDISRVDNEDVLPLVRANKGSTSSSSYDMGTAKTIGYENRGRWPANVIHDGSAEVVELFPNSKSTASTKTIEEPNYKNKVYGKGMGGTVSPENQYNDAGSAARFFYCPKANTKDRDDGLSEFEEKLHVQFATANGTSGKASSISEGRDTRRKNVHPTVKPTDLMRYLCAMITPPGGTVLDPFMGSGSTGRGALLGKFSFAGIEMSEEYLNIARARIDAILKQVA